MIYFSKESLALTSYIVKKNTDNIEYVSIKTKDLSYYLSLGSIIKPKVFLISLSLDKANKDFKVDISSHSRFNTSYICCEINRGLEKLIEKTSYCEYLNINSLAIRKELLVPYRDYFIDSEAYDLFWSLFKDRPRALQNELIRLELLKESQGLISLEILENLYRYKNFNIDRIELLIKKLGTKEASKIILDLEENDLFLAFLGTDKHQSYLVKHLYATGNKELLVALSILQNVFEYKKTNLKLLCLIFNNWLIEIDYVKIRYDSLIVLKNIKKLELLINE